ncbi:hypothetical protein HYQ46_009312 [Verticillium longisporum]|nr:hypothetical protein HYQ46_009312 [Verticillium longisporum]
MVAQPTQEPPHGRDLHELDRRVAKDDTRGEKTGKHNAIGDLGGNRRRRTERRTRSVLAGQAVDRNGDDDIERNGEGLQDYKAWEEVARRVLHLSKKTGKSDVASIGIRDL